MLKFLKTIYRIFWIAVAGIIFSSLVIFLGTTELAPFYPTQPDATHTIPYLVKSYGTHYLPEYLGNIEKLAGKISKFVSPVAAVGALLHTLVERRRKAKALEMSLRNFKPE